MGSFRRFLNLLLKVWEIEVLDALSLNKLMNCAVVMEASFLLLDMESRLCFVEARLMAFSERRNCSGRSCLSSLSWCRMEGKALALAGMFEGFRLCWMELVSLLCWGFWSSYII